MSVNLHVAFGGQRMIAIRESQTTITHARDMEEQLDHLGATKQLWKRTEKENPQDNLSMSDKKMTW